MIALVQPVHFGWLLASQQYSEWASENPPAVYAESGQLRHCSSEPITEFTIGDGKHQLANFIQSSAAADSYQQCRRIKRTGRISATDDVRVDGSPCDPSLLEWTLTPS